ncbi:hypothetical protein ACLI1A_18505 [Flavobacterium sp. RHBU_3]|uniref:hypothetical protein n=1 Tax=Flavobacterium sp. RHBU_3 TaxID=3391184 RepID=UPI003985254A
MSAEIESSKKTPQKREQKQKSLMPFTLREIENINSKTKESDFQNHQAVTEGNIASSGSLGIQPVHEANSLYGMGSQLKYNELAASLKETGDSSHPETLQKEKNYKRTLSIAELREYNDRKQLTAVTNIKVEKPVAENKTSFHNGQKETNGEMLSDAGINAVNDSPVQVLNAVGGIDAVGPTIDNNAITTEEIVDTSVDDIIQLPDMGITAAAPLAAAPLDKTVDTTTPLFILPQDNEKRMSFSKSIIKPLKTKVAASAPAPAPKTAGGIDATKMSGLEVSRSFMSTNPVIDQASDKGSIKGFKPQPAPDAGSLKNSGKNIMEKASLANEASVSNAGGQTDSAIQQNKAVNTIKPTINATPIKTDGIYNSKNLSSITPQLEALPGYKESINETNKIYVDEKIAPKLEEQKQAQEGFAKQQADAKNDNDRQINQQTAAVKAEQIQQQAAAQSEVARHKKDWKKESEQVKANYNKEAKSKKQSLGADVDNEVNAANTQINESYNRANKAAADETAKAKKAEADQRAEAAKKSKDKSLWDKAIDFVSDIFDALKKALNKLFDGLKAFVKRAIDTAKAFANALIDKLKEKVKRFISAFGEALKSIANVALAMFPKLRDKFNKFIDAAVNKALKAIDVLAEGLKKTINALLNVLGKVLTAILDAAQAYYNAILDVCKFLVIGLIKIEQFIFNLNIAAFQSGAEFFGALAEESLGGNPAEPLKDVEVPIGQEAQWAAAMAEGGGIAQKPAADEMAMNGDLLTKPKLDNNDVVLEPYPAVETDRSLLNSIPPLKDGEQFEIGGAGSRSVTTEQFQQAAYGVTEAGTEEMAQAQPAGNAGAKPDPDWQHMSDEQKLDEYNDKMLESSKDAGTTQPTPQQAPPQPDMDNSPEALVTKTGRLNPARRLLFMGEQMITGIHAMWNKYKAWIIGGLALALVAIAAILFFSGGTALGLVVEAIGEALMLIFGAVAVYRAMGSLWEYVKKAWAGDTKGAAKALATAFAIIVVEFLLDKILAGMGKVFKKMLKSFKATKVGRAVRNMLAVVRKGQRATTNVIRKGMVAIKNSKFVLYLEKIAAKGARKFDDLRNKILAKFGFKRIWFERHGRHMQLWGEFNSKVLLMDEEAEGGADFRELTEAERKLLGRGEQIGQRVDGGVVVSDAFEERFRDLSPEKQKEALETLRSDVYAQRRVEGLKGSGSTQEVTIPSKYKTEGLDEVSKRKPFQKKDIENLEKKALDRKADNGNPQKLRNHSEEIGEAAADAHANAHGLTKLKGLNGGAYSLDRVYQKGNTFYVFEAKGGSSTLGGKRVESMNLLTGDAHFAQQGSKEYLEKTIQDMRKSGNPEKVLIADKLSRAQKAGEVKYMMVQQKITKAGDLGEFIIREFDL